jgi:hypothetical protein
MVKKKKVKLQIGSKPGVPKWIPPEKRMRKYRKNMTNSSKVPFVKFRIIVPTEDDKKQLLACFEYIHDNPIMDCEEDFIVLNQIAHSYVTPELEKGHPDMIVVDPTHYKLIEQLNCLHKNTYIGNYGEKWCKDCEARLVTIYDDDDTQ